MQGPRRDLTQAERAILRDVTRIRAWSRIEAGNIPVIVSIDGSPVTPSPLPSAVRPLALARRAIDRDDLSYLRRQGIDPKALRRFRRERRQVHQQCVRESKGILFRCVSLTLQARRIDTAGAWKSRVSIWVYIQMLLAVGVMYILCPEIAHRAGAALVSRLESIAADLLTPDAAGARDVAPSL
jgi:hypothetical protein